MTYLHCGAALSNSPLPPFIIAGDEAASSLKRENADPRLVFLVRAAARLVLVEGGEMELDEAIGGLMPELEDGFEEFVELLAKANKAMRVNVKPAYRSTPQTTVEAILHCVRERGVSALKDPANKERLSRCDASARQQINGRIERLKAGVAP